MFFIFGTFALFGISLLNTPSRKFDFPWLGVFLLWCLAMVFTNKAPEPKQEEWFNFWLSAGHFIYVFSAVLLFYTVYCHAQDVKSYFAPIVIVCLMNIILSIAQLIGFDFMWQNANETCGFIGTGTQLAQYSSLTLPIVMVISPYLAGVSFGFIILSGSLTPMLAVLGGWAFLCWHRGRKRLVLVPLVLALAFAGANHRQLLADGANRLGIWKTTLKATLEKPYLGGGYGSFQETITEDKLLDATGYRNLSRAQNDYLHTAQELGIPAVIFIGAFFLSLYRKFKARKNKPYLDYFLAASIIIGLINMSGQTFIRFASLAGTFIVLLALLSAQITEVENASTL